MSRNKYTGTINIGLQKGYTGECYTKQNMYPISRTRNLKGVQTTS